MSLQFSSDLTMKAPAADLADALSSHGTSVYFYNFDHVSVHTYPAWFRCYHSLELDYVFGSPFNGYNIAEDDMKEHTSDDREASNKVMKLWTNFAKEG